MQPLYTLRDRCTAVCWSIAHFFQKLTGVAEAVGTRTRQGSSSMPRIRVSTSSPTSRLSLRGGNYSIYICYIVAALVVFLVLPCKWVKEGRSMNNIVLPFCRAWSLWPSRRSSPVSAA